ncbi:hypothetical protein J2Z29_001978 [Treponema pedis]
MPTGKLVVFFSPTILAAENKASYTFGSRKNLQILSIDEFPPFRNKMRNGIQYTTFADRQTHSLN